MKRFYFIRHRESAANILQMIATALPPGANNRAQALAKKLLSESIASQDLKDTITRLPR
ncbi:MAG: hypothetical protein KGQ93_07130 [Cyanobacteria bacterium REEB459]|nr:hypothetical protein [Cyanobacteria bacterium REEB459]